MSDFVPDGFAGATVLTPDGESVSVRELWADGTVVFALVRQFG